MNKTQGNHYRMMLNTQDCMDNVMLMFKESEPEFYNSYERARTIVDL